LSDFFRTIAGVELFRRGGFAGNRGFCIGDLQLEPARIELSRYLTRRNPVAFLHKYGGDPPAIIESYLHFAKVNVSIEHD
jgi:hypothetical protein